MHPTDFRNISTGSEIPTLNYSDQPFVIKTDDRAWLCVLTTGSGHEGHPGQHVVALRSENLGKTWSSPVPLEDPRGPEASYAVLLKVPGGRIYCFYNHNSDNLREVQPEQPEFFPPDGICRRVDSLGYYVFKFSDDHGRTWSDWRYPIPVRLMAIDRDNVYAGRICFFWNVGKPFIHEGAAFVSLHKVGGLGEGFFMRSEGVLLKSRNLLTEKNPEKITWETLPDGDFGLRTPPCGGPIAEEQSYSVLSDGSFFCVYRTIDGFPACTYSRDGGHIWSTPTYLRSADGRRIKHPRAANFAWKCENGKFLYWFHHHGGRFIPLVNKTGYEDRNPVWLAGGIETDSADGKIIQWSQPEIVLYDDDPYIRISYPDLIEENGRYFLTETQKDMARVHEIDRELIEGLWGQFDLPRPATRGLALDWSGEPAAPEIPRLPLFLERDTTRADYGRKSTRTGFSIELWLTPEKFSAGEILLDSRTENGQGLCLRVTDGGAVEISLNDGRTENRWASDPGCLQTDTRNHVAIVVDAGPRIISFIKNGRFCDGGDFRQFGWGRFSPDLRHANGAEMLKIAPDFSGSIHRVKIFNRCLRTSEVIGNFRIGP